MVSLKVTRIKTMTRRLTPRVPAPWQEWVIAIALVALAAVGFVTVFDDEIAHWRGVDQMHGQGQNPPSGSVSAPPVAGNTQGTL
jgi:hypothetical protein